MFWSHITKKLLIQHDQLLNAEFRKYTKATKSKACIILEKLLDNFDGICFHPFPLRPVPSSGPIKVIPNPTKFSILYKGNMCVYEGIPAEKVTPCGILWNVCYDFCTSNSYLLINRCVK